MKGSNYRGKISDSSTARSEQRKKGPSQPTEAILPRWHGHFVFIQTLFYVSGTETEKIKLFVETDLAMLRVLASVHGNFCV